MNCEFVVGSDGYHFEWQKEIANDMVKSYVLLAVLINVLKEVPLVFIVFLQINIVCHG